VSKSSKPWLKYHKSSAPVRDVPPLKKKPRQLIWARLWLLAGFHRFYLGQPLKALLFFLALFTALPIGMVTAAILKLDRFVPLEIIAFVPYFGVFVVEYIRLPTLVKNANIKIFGPRAKYAPEMQGNIGPYYKLRPIVLLIIAIYAFAIVSVDYTWPEWTSWVMMGAIFSAFVAFFIQLSRIFKRSKTGTKL